MNRLRRWKAEYEEAAAYNERLRRDKEYAREQMALIHEQGSESRYRERINRRIAESAERLGVDPAGLMGGWPKPKIRTK